MRQQRENELRAVRAEMLALSDAQVQQAKIDAKHQFEARFTELQQAQVKELEHIMSQLTNMQEENSLLKDRLKEMENATNSGQEEIEQMKLKCDQSIEEFERSAVAQFESRANDLRTVLQNDYEQKLQQFQAHADSQAQKSLEEAAVQHREEMETKRKTEPIVQVIYVRHLYSTCA